jgi:hypothetical protein
MTPFKRRLKDAVTKYMLAEDRGDDSDAIEDAFMAGFHAGVADALYEMASKISYMTDPNR